MTRALCLAAVALLACGCATSRLADRPAVTLADANARLDGRQARVVLVDGCEISAEAVALAVAQTTLTERDTGVQRTIPTDSVAAVAVRASSRVGDNALYGALPGLATATAGAGRLVFGDLFGGLEWVGTGLILAVPGSLGGALLGDLDAAARWVVVYRSPLLPAPR